jgi:F5/8 type C domain
MSSPSATQSQPTAANSVKEWFWRSDALKDAKSASTVSDLRRERLRRARLAAEFAGRMIDPAEPWYDGSALPLAISLYREAAYWVLLAHSDAAETQSLRELLAAASFTTSGLSAADVALLKDALGEKTFVETAEESLDTLRKQAVAARTFVQGMIRDELAAQRKVSRLLLQRMLRVGVVVLAVVAVVLAIYSSVQRALRGPDLAAGKPWTASSSAYTCKPAERECGGGHTAIFFHTLEEDKPWVQFDLGSPKKFRRLEVVNRDDCCTDRAVPLVFETSDDGKQFKEVARSTEPFDTWEATFKPVTARYIRLRIDRRTYLHLVRVSVYPN